MMHERLMEWLGLLLNNQRILRVDFDDPDQKDAFRLLLETDMIEREESGSFRLHSKWKAVFDEVDKILSIHEKLARIKAELGASPFSTSPAKAELLKLIS